MTPEQLKASILQYAIQGKLVDQRTEEGTAEELYQQIQANLDASSKVQSKKKAKNTILPIEEKDIPFDIPETWKWVRLGMIGYTNIGLTYSPKDQTVDGVIVLRSSMIRESSPPLATFASGLLGSPGLVEIMKETSSQPSGPIESFRSTSTAKST